MKTKTGECYFIDEDNNLCIAESFVNEKGEVVTETKIVTPSEELL